MAKNKKIKAKEGWYTLKDGTKLCWTGLDGKKYTAPILYKGMGYFIVGSEKHHITVLTPQL